MVTIRQKVRIQEGGRIEVISRDLPAGEEAEVTVSVPGANGGTENCIGAFADDAELMDQVVAEAMAARAHPLRNRRG